MRVAVVGASGRTGRHVVARALERGDDVVAIARHLEGAATDRLRPVATDVLDERALADALRECDAVVSTLGIGTSRAATTVYSAGVANILAAMAEQRIGRLAVVSAAPVGPRADQPRGQRLVIMPVLDRFFDSTYADMARMEARLERSDLDWACLRPPRLVAKPATGSYRIDTAPLPGARTLTFADLAAALLDSLDRPDLQRRPAYVAN